MGVQVLELECDALTERRTKDSLAFETAWRALPRRGIIPDRSDMSLHKFKHMLPDIALMDIVPGSPVRSRICIVGERIRERLSFPVIGEDYFHFVPAHLRPMTARRLQALVTQPCGLWQVLGIHYQRGLFKSLEVTAFPLARQDGPPQIMVLAVYSRGQVSDVPADLALVSMERASATVFLDLGAGRPSWPYGDG